MKIMKVGIIGCGGIFSQHAFPLHLNSNTEVVAVCDNKPAPLADAKALFNYDGYSDYHELLKRDDIDVIHVLTPHNLHAPMVIDAANAGKHVLTEKPMSIGLDEAKKMLEAGKRNGITIGVISQNRYNACSQAVKKAVVSGSLGKVISQRVILTFGKPESYYKASDWRGTWEQEGGALLIDQSVHQLDLARWIADGLVSSVDASLTNRRHPYIKTEDTAEGLVEYHNGASMVFYATNNLKFDAPPLVETYCEKGIASLGMNDATITYTDGTENLVVNNPMDGYDEAEFIAFFKKTPFEMAMKILKQWGIVGSPITWKGSHGFFGLSHIKQINNFYESLAAGVRPDIDAEEAIKSQAMMWGIYESAKTQTTIRFD